MSDESDVSERSESGSPIYRHKPRTIPFDLSTGDGSLIDAVDAHIQRHLGPVESVYHEIVSDLVHIDVHIVIPRPERNFYTLVTSGMSEAPMNTPAAAQAYRFAELMICLPPDWPLGLNRPKDAPDPLADTDNFWPIGVLKATARMPHAYDTWLGYGHTLSNGDPTAPYTANTKLCALALFPSLNTPKAFWCLEDGNRQTHFWSLYPLYAEELAFKMKHGGEALLDKFANAGVTDLLDPHRKNTCRKKWFGLF